MFVLLAEKLKLFDRTAKDGSGFIQQRCFGKAKTRLQLLYTDVQQLKMVQMVSQSQFFRGFYLFYLMRLPVCWKNVRNFISLKCNS